MQVCNLVYTARVQPMEGKLHVRGNRGGACVVHPSGHTMLMGFKKKVDALVLFKRTVQSQHVQQQPVLVNAMYKTRLKGGPFNLHAIAHGHPDRTRYNPRMKNLDVDCPRRVKCTIFPSGRVVVMGPIYMGEAMRMVHEVKTLVQ